MSLIIAILLIWLLWRLIKFSFWLFGLLLVIALVGFLVKALLIPAIVLIFGGLALGIGSVFR